MITASHTLVQGDRGEIVCQNAAHAAAETPKHLGAKENASRCLPAAAASALRCLPLVGGRRHTQTFLFPFLGKGGPGRSPRYSRPPA